jgi:probable F420-dependent oxidoreductase
LKLRLGIVTPVVHINPRFDPPPPAWESTGTIDDIVFVAQAAERAGYEWVSASEHIAIPEEATAARGPRYWDPLCALSFMAANTSRISLLSHVVVLSYHHPLEVVKRWGTLDIASRGRVILGVGVGSLEPEFELLGHQFGGRGERADDSLRAIRSTWGVRTPSYHGTHFDFDGFIVEPSGLSRPLEIWVGGRTRRSLRRAIDLGEGWIPFRLLPDDLSTILKDPQIIEMIDRRDKPLELIFPPEPPLDPLGAPDATEARVLEYVAAGATALSLRFEHYSRPHYVEQMEAMKDIVDAL